MGESTTHPPRRTLANQHRGPANSVNLPKLGESKIVVDGAESVNGRLRTASE